MDIILNILNPDLISIGNNNVIESHSSIQPHSYEYKNYKLQEINIGNYNRIENNVIILGGINIKDNNRIERNTLLMKNMPMGMSW